MGIHGIYYHDMMGIFLYEYLWDFKWEYHGNNSRLRIWTWFDVDIIYGISYNSYTKKSPPNDVESEMPHMT